MNPNVVIGANRAQADSLGIPGYTPDQVHQLQGTTPERIRIFTDATRHPQWVQAHQHLLPLLIATNTDIEWVTK